MSSGDELPQPPALDSGAGQPEELLSVERLSTTFFTRDGHVPAVRSVSFKVRRGEVVGLVGESGSGKSVTARSIIGLVPQPGRIVEGRVMFKDRDLVHASPKELREIRGAEMSMVLQEPMSSLNPLLTIGDQVAEMFTAHPQRRPKGTSTSEAVIDILRRVHIPDPLRRQAEYPMHFSGGMRQRVAIAMAAALSPDLIIADEPTTALDVTIQAQMLDLLLDLRDQLGTGMLFITHDMGVVAQICDTVAVMYAGQIVEYADVFTLFEQPSHPYTQALLRSLPTLDERRDRLPSIAGHPPDLMSLGAGCPFADRCEHVFDRCRVEDPPLFQVGVAPGPIVHSRCWLHEGHAVRDDGTATTEPVSELADELIGIDDVGRFDAPAEAREMSEMALEIVGLHKHFSSGAARSVIGRGGPPVRAVDGITFAVAKGESFGLVGESGSGKTTVAKLILRLEDPTAGEIRFREQDIAGLRRRELRAFRGATHIVFQDPNSSLSPRMRVREIIGEPLRVQGVRGKALATRVADALDRVGLRADVGHRYPHEFSGGQRQRIAIARAIAPRPEVIVLDEPVSALDVSIRAQILNLLRSLQEDLQLTYVTIAHDLAVVYQACDRTGVMYVGKLVELAPSEALYKRPLHPYTRVLLSAIPLADPRRRERRRIPLVGEVPSPANPPAGCRFHTRCPYAIDRCRTDEPEWREVEPGRWVACHLVTHDADGTAVLEVPGRDDAEPAA